MTQPAKVQEPSMEEILASIRRIIADDEAKPAAAEKPSSPVAAPAKPEKPAAAAPAAKPVMNDIPPSAIPAAQAAAAKVAAPPLKPAAPPVTPPAAPIPAPNSQDDIDALLSGLDESTTPSEIRPPLPDGDVFELTDEMALPDPPQPSFNKIEPKDDPEFTETAAAKALHRQPAFEPAAPPLESPAAPQPQQILSHSTVSAVESAFNTLANTVLSNNARTLGNAAADA